MPRGGRRPGSGRKPKPKPKQASVIAHPSSSGIPTTNALPAVEEFDAPDSLSMDERHVWLQQAPHAFAARTLTRATAMAFERYCRIVVMEKNEAKSSAAGAANHRGLLKQINAYELQFLLIPCGKPIAVPVMDTKDVDDEFFSHAGSQSA